MRLMLTLLTLLACIYSGTSTGQANPEPRATDDKDQQQPMEEITVIGQRTLGTLRVQINRAEDRIYEIFNKLNNDDLYDIHCNTGGIYIKYKSCSPVYFSRTEADATYYALTGSGGGSAYMLARLSRYNVIMGQKWKQLVTTNPELLHAVIKHYELTQKLKKDRRAYYGRDVEPY